MVEIKLIGHNVDEIVAIVRDLRSQGLTQGEDFNFKWVPPKHDWLGDGEPGTASFYFYTEEYATLFSLKYT